MIFRDSACERRRRIVSDDGNAEAACVNALCCALIDADVAMHGLICANACAILSDGTKVIDPTKREENEARAWCARAR